MFHTCSSRWLSNGSLVMSWWSHPKVGAIAIVQVGICWSKACYRSDLVGVQACIWDIFRFDHTRKWFILGWRKSSPVHLHMHMSFVEILQNIILYSNLAINLSIFTRTCENPKFSNFFQIWYKRQSWGMRMIYKKLLKYYTNLRCINNPILRA